MTTVTILFWACAALVFYTYLGYGLLLWPLVRLREAIRPRKALADPAEWPEATLLIAAYNEEEVVAQKMANCRALDYPPGRLRIVWVTDGSTDRTAELLADYPEVRVLHDPRRAGKTAALNRAMPFVTTPIVLFTDANTFLNPEAVREIVRCFADPAVGCVAGEKRVAAAGEHVATKSSLSSEPARITSPAGPATHATAPIPSADPAARTASAAATEGVYWRYESKLKELDSRLATTVGAAGELYAVRRELFEILPEDTLLDDFVCSMRIAARGYRIAYCKEAYALETPSADMREEGKRKRRIAAGGLQAVWRLRRLLNPFRYGVLTFQYVSHRVLRWTLTPLALVVLLPLNIVLIRSTHPGFWSAVLALQVAFWLAAAAGWAAERAGRRSRLLFIPYYFAFMNLNVFRGIGYLLKRRGSGAWEKARRAG